MGRKMSITQFDLKPVQSFRNKSTRMTKFIEFWGADKPFANITDSKLVQNLQITVCKTMLGNIQPVLNLPYHFYFQVKIVWGHWAQTARLKRSCSENCLKFINYSWVWIKSLIEVTLFLFISRALPWLSLIFFHLEMDLTKWTN